MALSRAELKKTYAEKAKTPSTKYQSRAIAEVIDEIIEPNRLTTEVVRLFMDFENLNVGDAIRKQVRKGKYITRSFVPGMDLLTQKPPTWQEKYLFMNDWLYAGASSDVWAIESGDVDSVERMRSDLGADIIEHLALKAFDVLSTVWNASDTPSNYVDASSSGLTATILDAAIENEIREVGGVRAIVGTRTALLPVYKFAGYREISNTVGGTPNPLSTILPIPEKLYEYENTLRVSSYHGVPLVELPNTRRMRLPNLQEFVVPTNKALVIGENPGTFFAYGQVAYQDHTNTERIPADYYLYAWQRYSVLIDRLEAITVLKTAAVSE